MNEERVKGHTEEGETLEFKKRPLRKVEKPAKYKDYVTYLIMKDQKIIPEPNSVENALSGPNSNYWKKAMKNELNAMINEVYELVDYYVRIEILENLVRNADRKHSRVDRENQVSSHSHLNFMPEFLDIAC